MSFIYTSVDRLNQIKLWDNSLFHYIIAFLIMLISMIALLILNKVILTIVRKRVEKAGVSFNRDVLNALTRNINPILFFLSLYFSTFFLKLHEYVHKSISVFGFIIFSFFGLRLISKLVKIYVEFKWKDQEKYAQHLTSFRSIFPALNITIWVIGLVFFLSNLGFNISAIITGLGIGGIAIAMAAQAILGDLFSYFAIVFDKPFEIGDFVIFENQMGTIEHIGLKTTKIRSLSGEQVVVSNSVLTKSLIKNYKRMAERRVVFTLGVSYETPVEMMEAIPDKIRDIILSEKATRFDRAHFNSFGQSSLDFEIVYYVNNPDYNTYMNIQQAINVKIMKYFQESGVDFAYPTQTLYLKKISGLSEK